MSASDIAPITSPAVTPTPRRAPRLLDATVWREAALLWLAQRALVVLFAWAGARAMVPGQPLADLFGAWDRWDGGIFTGIAVGGYTLGMQAQFYPLLPTLERALVWLMGGANSQDNAWVAGVVIANLATLVAFGLLRALVERELGRAAARRSLVYLAVFPTAFYLVAPYSEGLFLALSVAYFVALRSRRWALAGLLAALAALTRPEGALLVVAALVELARDWRARHPVSAPRPGGAPRRAGVALVGAVGRALAVLGPPVVALVGLYVALWRALGVGGPLRAEAGGQFGRSLAAPWVGYQRVVAALLATSDSYQIGHILLDGAFTTLFIGLTLGMTLALWRRIPRAYLAYAWASLLLPLVTPAHSWYALGSTMRFMLVVFPLFMALGIWGERRWVGALVLALSLPLLALLTAVFTVGGWVA